MTDVAVQISQRARSLWWGSIVIGAIAMAIGVAWTMSPNGPGFDWIWAVAAFGIGAIVYNVSFFAFCSLFISSLAGMVEDDTEIEGDTVTHVVRHGELGNEDLDFYIRAYATARGVTATSIVAGIMIAGALWFF